MADNPLVGRFDTGAVALVADVLRQALRPIRIRLVNRIGADVPMELVSCEFIQLGPLLERLYEEEVRLLARVRMSPAGLPILAGMDTPLLFRIMGMLMGESPWGEPAAVDHRPLTSTDVRVATRVLEDVVGGLEDGLPRTANQQLTLEKVSDDPRLDLGLSATAGMFDVKIQIGDAENPLGNVILGLPTSVVPRLFPDLPSERVDSAKAERQAARVLPIRVDAVAELARVKTTLSKLQQLTVGDTRPIGRLRQIEVRVRDRVALIGEPGLVDGVRCVRVIRNVHELGAPS